MSAFSSLIDSATSLFRGKSDGTPGSKRPNPDSQTDNREEQPDVELKKLEDWFQGRWDEIKTTYLTYHQMIWRCLLFYVGETWLTWSRANRQWVPMIMEDDYTPTPRISQFATTIDAIASNFGNVPVIDCIAQDAEGDEQYKRHGVALVAGRLGRDFLTRTGLKSDFRAKGDRPAEAATTFTLTGGLYTELYLVKKSPTQTALGPMGGYQVEVDVVNPLYILPRPGASNIGGTNGTSFLFIARRFTLAEIEQRFQVVAASDNEYVDGYNSTYENQLNYYYTGFNALQSKNNDSALVCEIFVPPTDENNAGVKELGTDGMYGVYVNEKVQWSQPWQYPEWPITKFDYKRIPTLFFARTPAFELCDLQTEYQEYESIIKLHGMTNAVSPWVVDENSQVSEITGRADKVIKWRSLGPGSQRPTREQAGHLDQGIYATLQRLKAEFANISGAANVFKGRQEGSVTAGVAISQLRGQAELMFSGPAEGWANGWKETTRKAVGLMQKVLTVQQVQAIVGDNQEQAISDFFAADLSTEVEFIATNGGLPRTKDELREEMMNLFDRGALDMSQPDVREHLFELFGETGMMTMFNLDATRARMENKAMRQALPPTFMPQIEDLQVHYQIHIEAIKSLDFDRLPQPAKDMMMQHALETQQVMQQMAAAAAAAAAPPGKSEQGHSSLGGSAGAGKPSSPTTPPKAQGVQPIGASQGAPPA
jgi:hypothetical protein